MTWPYCWEWPSPRSRTPKKPRSEASRVIFLDVEPYSEGPFRLSCFCFGGGFLNKSSRIEVVGSGELMLRVCWRCWPSQKGILEY